MRAGEPRPEAPRPDLGRTERNEALAFDRMAAGVDRTSLRTGERTFARYRGATRSPTPVGGYPDRLFWYVGRRLALGEAPERPLAGLRVLDLGAGDGAWSVVLAEQGADVVAVEISPKQTELAEERMRLTGLRWEARVASAYRLAEEFPEGAFDLVFGQGVLHHLTQGLDDVYRGIRHVLRAGGYGVFVEPYVGSALLRSARERLAWLVPIDRESPDERPLTAEDLRPLRDLFPAVEVEHFDLFEKVGRRLERRSLARALARSDAILLRCRALRSLASMVFVSVRR